MSWSISSASLLRSVCPIAPLAPWSASSRARCTTSVIVASAESVVSTQPLVSLIVRLSCAMPLSSERRRRALCVASGSSDGLSMRRPDAIWRCAVAMRCVLARRSLSSRRPSMPSVTRPALTARPVRSG
jgi:hypothetical protein